MKSTNFKFRIQVRDQEGKIIESITRMLRREQCGNFAPIFCNYKGNKRTLVHSDIGDLSDPFRQADCLAGNLFIKC